MNTVLLFRKIILAAAGNRFVKGFMNKYGMRLGARRFVAAESLEETIIRVKALNDEGFAVTLDYLGESVNDLAMAEDAVNMIMRMFDEIRRHNLDSNISVKLTQLGLSVNERFCLSQLNRIVEKAKECGNFVRIDMEDSSVTDATLRIFHTMLTRYGAERVGIVIQAYLYRSLRDIELLQEKAANVRIVKGAYCEPKEVAHPDKQDVDRAYIALAKSQLQSDGYTAIATHDARLIERLREFQYTHGLPQERMEFQMLYGIAEELQRHLLQDGCRVRIYTPFGKHWYSYFTRRIAERPANLLFVLKSIFRRKREHR